MIKIGLTGNIASGKSTVEEIIKNLGFLVFDLDIVSHNLLEGECKNKVLEEFGTIKRNELARIVFSNKEKLIKLENIIYPELEKFILKVFNENNDKKAVFISGALILDKGFKKYFDKTIFIDAEYSIRLERLIKRNNYSSDEAKIRMAAQDDSNKVLADFIINNNEDKTALKNNVCTTLKELNLFE